jgi:membrane protease subunit HflC
VVRLGSRSRVTQPGLNVKVPFIDSVIGIDKRILDLEAPAQEVIASDQKRLVVDAFARYRIQDVLRFYQTLGSIQGANSQLTTCSTPRCARARRGDVHAAFATIANQRLAKVRD